MNRLSQEAQTLIRSMQDRIDRQAAEVVKLSVYRGDASYAIRRLELMRIALAEMRVQLQAPGLTERTDLSNTAAAMTMLSRKIKSAK